MPRMSKRWKVGAAIAAIAAIAVVVVVTGAGRARITGSTPRERIKSICRLADTRPWGAGDVLAKAAVEESEVRVRQAALVALARIVQPKYRAVVEQCTGDASPAVRASAVATLGRYADAASADRLGELVATDPDSTVRRAAVTGLGRNPDARATVWLVEAVEKNDRPMVQFVAIQEAYRRLGMRYIGEEPDRVPDWPKQAAIIAEYLKEFPAVGKAYKEARQPLVRRPEHRVVPECEANPPGGSDPEATSP